MDNPLGLLSISILFLCAIIAIFTRGYGALLFVFALICLQNIIGIIIAGIGSQSLSQLLVLYKELVVYGTVAIAVLLFHARPLRQNKTLCIFLVLLFVFFIIGENSIYAKLANLRSILTPIVLFLFGACLVVNSTKLISFLKVVIVCGFAMSVFGLVECYVLDSSFWTDIGIAQFYQAKGFDTWLSAKGLPAQFYSYDFYQFIGTGVRRMASLLAEPIAFGHLMALCFAVLLYDRDEIIKNRPIKTVFLAAFALVVFMSLSKGAILALFIAFFVRVFNPDNPLGYLFFLVFTAVGFVFISGNMTSSMMAHSTGLFESLSGHLFVGEGIGEGGNFAGLYGESGEGGESFIGALIVQMGMPCALLFLASFGKVLYKIAKPAGSFDVFKQSGYPGGVFLFVLSCLIESFVSESALSFIGCGTGFIMLGILYNATLKNSDVASLKALLIEKSQCAERKYDAIH